MLIITRVEPKLTISSRIRRDVPIPYYYQLMQVLQETIKTGTWSEDIPLPSEHELCAIYGVSRTVVRQALGELEGNGLLYRVKGKGTFVTPPKVEEHFIQRTDGFYHDMTSLGHIVSTRVVEQTVVVPSVKIWQRLGLEKPEDVIKIGRVRSVDGHVLLYVESFIPQRLCPSLIDADLSNASLYATLRDLSGLTVVSGTRTVEAVSARPPLTTLLDVHRGEPLLRIESVGCAAEDRPVEYFEAWHRGDRSKIEITIDVIAPVS